MIIIVIGFLFKFHFKPIQEMNQNMCNLMRMFCQDFVAVTEKEPRIISDRNY